MKIKDRSHIAFARSVIDLGLELLVTDGGIPFCFAENIAVALAGDVEAHSYPAEDRRPTMYCPYHCRREVFTYLDELKDSLEHGVYVRVPHKLRFEEFSEAPPRKDGTSFLYLREDSPNLDNYRVLWAPGDSPRGEA